MSQDTQTLQQELEAARARIAELESQVESQVVSLRQTPEEQQAFLRTVLDALPNLIFVKDWDGRFQVVNRALAEIYNTTVEELTGKTDADFNPDAEQVAAFLEADRQVIRSGEPLRIPEETVTGPDGETVWVQTTKMPMTTAEGERYIVGVATDITQLKQAQAQIIEAQQRAIRALSTPVIPLVEGIIAVPIIGDIDDQRARDIMRGLLDGISRNRAKIVILDVTGVSSIDSGVADYLNKAIQAARLKGATTYITGISDAVAETVVDLGIDWSAQMTLRDLQTGLQNALESAGWRLSRHDAKGM